MASTYELLLLSRMNAQPQLLGSTILTSSAASITIPTAAAPAASAFQVAWQARSDTAATAINFLMTFNGDTASHYLWQKAETNNTATNGSNSGALVAFIQVGTIPAASASASFFGTGYTVVSNPNSTVGFKSCSGQATACISATNAFTGTYGGLWESTSAVTSITLKALAGNLVAGSMATVYAL